VGARRALHRHPLRGADTGDFDVLASHRSSIVWSPFSNLLLYGGTARVEAAKAAGVTIGLGSDWSPSGSKNLLGELKVASLYNEQLLNGLFKTRELVAMATRNAAQILKWTTAAGTLEPGKRADLIVIDGAAGDPYDALIRARETDLLLVMINGVAPLRQQGADGRLRASGPERQGRRRDAAAVPEAGVGGSCGVAGVARHRDRHAARTRSRTSPSSPRRPRRQGRSRNPRRVARSTRPSPSPGRSRSTRSRTTGMELRPRCRSTGPRDFTGPVEGDALLGARGGVAAALDAARADRARRLTVADDDDFLDQVESEANVPERIRKGLRALY
jgi:hypothetical protein